MKQMLVILTAVGTVFLVLTLLFGDLARGSGQHAFSFRSAFYEFGFDNLLLIALPVLVFTMMLALVLNSRSRNSRLIPSDWIRLNEVARPSPHSDDNSADRYALVREALGVTNDLTPFSLAFAQISLERPDAVSSRGSQTMHVGSDQARFESLRKIDLHEVLDDSLLGSNPQDEVLVVCVGRYRCDRQLTDFEVEVGGRRWTTVNSKRSSSLLVKIITARYTRLSATPQADDVFIRLISGILKNFEHSSSIPLPMDEISSLRLLLLLKNPKESVDFLTLAIEDAWIFRPIWTEVRISDIKVDNRYPDWFQIKTQYTRPVEPGRSLVERVRRKLFWLAPREVVLPLFGALESKSFHFTYQLPMGNYVYDTVVSPNLSGHESWRALNSPTEKSGVLSSKAIRYRARMARIALHRGRFGEERRLVASHTGGTRPVVNVVGNGSDAIHVYVKDYRRLIFKLEAISSRRRKKLFSLAFRSVSAARENVTDRSGVARGFERKVVTVPTLYADTRERPPGILFPVFCVGLYSTVVAASLARWEPDVSNASTGVWWGVTVFGLPPVITAWVLSKISKSAFDRASFVVIVVAIWGSINPIALTLCCFINLARQDTFSYSGWLFPKHMGEVNDVLLAATCVSCVSNVVLCVTMMMARLARFQAAVKPHFRSESNREEGEARGVS